MLDVALNLAIGLESRVQVELEPVCRVYWLVVARLTFSRMSISPLFGQLSPTVQKAGQTWNSRLVEMGGAALGTYRAAKGHVQNVGNKKSAGILIVGLYADTNNRLVSWIRGRLYYSRFAGLALGEGGGVVDLEDCDAVGLDIDEASRGGIGLAEVVDLAVGGVAGDGVSTKQFRRRRLTHNQRRTTRCGEIGSGLCRCRRSGTYSKKDWPAYLSLMVYFLPDEVGAEYGAEEVVDEPEERE